ncbi:hypothetical protein G3M48_008192 [Beauveria asiatica]|uniref:Uncharacterized protein n=1 Tax=Beauveria asiatica TaxID=1069075 RepID=A0AAW0RKU8_9HYPO
MANMPSTASESPSSLEDHDLQKGFNAREKFQKPLKFHLTFLSILLMVFIVSIDATALAVVIPEETSGKSAPETTMHEKPRQ